jgi:hypothetical protein
MRVLALTLLTALAGCERAPWDRGDAEDVLHAYLGALVEGDPGQAYQHLSGADRAVRTEGEWRSAAPRYGRYQIVRVDQYADLATAQVELAPAPASKASPPGRVIDDAHQSPPPAAPVEPEEEPARTQSFTLVREGPHWKVYLGETADPPPLAAADARSGGPAPQRPAAPAEPDGVQAGSAPPASAGAIQAERDGLQLYGLRAGYYRSYSGRSTPGVEFKLRNRSGQTVTRAVVTVYFLDAAGNPIWEEKYFPVRTDPDGFLSTPALKPGYIWQVERGKFLLAESVPEEWKRGAVRAEITEIQFAPTS